MFLRIQQLQNWKLEDVFTLILASKLSTSKMFSCAHYLQNYQRKRCSKVHGRFKTIKLKDVFHKSLVRYLYLTNVLWIIFTDFSLPWNSVRRESPNPMHNENGLDTEIWNEDWELLNPAITCVRQQVTIWSHHILDLYNFNPTFKAVCRYTLASEWARVNKSTW